MTIAGYAVVVLLVLVVGLTTMRGGHVDPWATQAGLETRGKFLAGCAVSTGGTVDCQCAFATVTEHAPYDTPQGLFGLAQLSAVGLPASGTWRLPAAYREALRACPARVTHASPDV